MKSEVYSAQHELAVRVRQESGVDVPNTIYMSGMSGTGIFFGWAVSTAGAGGDDSPLS